MTQGRRTLRFNSLDEVMPEVERLLKGHSTVGTWSLAQICRHLSTVMRQYMGDTRGRWEGATLVVDTTNLTGLTGVGANGRALFHSSALRLTERFTRISADIIQYTVRIDDPEMWSRPWTMSFPLARDPGYGMFEYACHEGNYGMPNLLRSARAEDQAAKAGTKEQ